MKSNGFTSLDGHSRLLRVTDRVERIGLLRNALRNYLTGFTLVETLIAITVLTVAIVGPYHAVQTALNVSFVARDELVATSLAQEGLEYVRSVRDSNFDYNVANPASAGTWLYGLDGTTRAGVTGRNCFSGTQCTVDITQASVVNAIEPCSGVCAPLNVAINGLYTQSAPSGYVVSKYTRSVTLTTINPHEAQVSSTVSWKTLGLTHTITVTNNLQNWL